MYEMLTGLPPFYAQDVQQMYFKIMHAKLDLPENFDPTTKSILMGVCFFQVEIIILFFQVEIFFKKV